MGHDQATVVLIVRNNPPPFVMTTVTDREACESATVYLPVSDRLLQEGSTTYHDLKMTKQLMLISAIS